MQDIKSFLDNLPHYPGVYQMLGTSGEVLYIGKAKNLKKRVSSYFAGAKDLKTQTLVQQIKDIDITVTNTENEAVLLECNLIKKYMPPYNILLRDDKSYPYIVITNLHDYPRIDLYRGLRKKDALYFGPYPNVGAVRETINLMQKLFGIRTCSNTYFAARSRPCLLYQIGRCTGPCVELIAKEDYAKNIQLAVLFLQGKSNEVVEELQQEMERAASVLNFELAARLRDQVSRLRQIQDKQYVDVGDSNVDAVGLAVRAGVVCIQLLSIRAGRLLGSRSYFPKVPAHSEGEEIVSAFLAQHYLNHPSHIESIPKEIIVGMDITDKGMLENTLSAQAGFKVNIAVSVRGDKKKWLAMAETTASQSLVAKMMQKANIEERILELQKVLDLAELPRRMECYDISHSMGEATVGSCVVFDRNGPLKSDYRRFNITDITPGDDPAAMRQVLSRRFKRLQKEDAVLPDIVFIDGGAAQLNMAARVMSELNVAGMLLIGISKGPDRKAGFETLHFVDLPPMHLPADSPALHLIQQIRDEAHRFAITGHRQRRDKTRRQSSLELVPGIGAKRRRELLRYFGGIQGVAHASLDELSKVPGISRSLAERIFAAFHDATS
ncbi:MAG: excinuclease ABC subunit UvrC [Gammaproteobacteria bacterium]